MPHTAKNQVRKALAMKSKDELQKMLLALKLALHNKTDLEDSERLIRAIEIERVRSIKDQDQGEKPDIDAVVFGIEWERSTLRQRLLRRRWSRG